MTRANRWERMHELVDDEMLDAVVPSATFAALPATLASWYGGLSRRISLSLPDDPAHDSELARAVGALRGAS